MHPNLPLLFVAALVVTPLADAQTLIRSVNGPAAGAQFGKACLVVPDQNADGVKDVLVGAPGFNGQRGAVYCVSGAYLAFGSGAIFLWSSTPSANVGDQFGVSLANVGDVSGDGVIDFVAGQPGYDSTSTDAGAVRMINGSSHAAAAPLFWNQAIGRMGVSVVKAADLDGDGRAEVVVGAPGNLPGSLVLTGAALPLGGITSASNTSAIVVFGNEWGTSASGRFDYDGDGREEVAYGAPAFDSPSALDAGSVNLFSFAPGATLRSYTSTVAGERLGQSVSMGQDYDGDGAADIVAGAPNATDVHGHQVGRVVVLSGKRVFDQTPPYEIYTFFFGTATPPVNHADPDPNFHFGASVLACPDLNNDGVGEIIAGAPDYFTPGLLGGFNFRGMVRIYSGATGALLATITGSSTDRLGEGLAGAVDDLDGDGFKEFVVAGALSDAGGVDSGVIRCYRLFPLAPSTYCTSKANSLGCTPAIGSSGTPSASSGAPFTISVTNLINQKNGLLFYSGLPTSVLFQGGFKCVANPAIRTPPFNSGGAASGASCTGAFSIDFNAWVASGFDPALSAGSEVFAQHWSRDPASPSKTGLSNALRFVIHP